MTKTKKTLNWKLTEAPTAKAVAELVAQEVITPAEAREMLFGSREYDVDKTKALEEQVEFLQGLVSELAKSKVTNINYTYPTPLRYTNTPFWTKTDTMLCNSGLGTVLNQADNTVQVLSISGSESIGGGAIGSLPNSFSDSNVSFSTQQTN